MVVTDVPENLSDEDIISGGGGEHGTGKCSVSDILDFSSRLLCQKWGTNTCWPYLRQSRQ